MKVTLLTDLEFRVWTQYLLSADDFGVMRASALTLQADNDHLANRPQKAIQRALEQIIKVGLVHAFEHQNRRYVYQRDWQTWQKVSYPRGTNQPMPVPEALQACNEETRELFRLHPGGKGRRFPKRSENISETVQEFSENVSEKSPTTRAGAPADRLMANAKANGERLTANGAALRGEGLDVAFAEFMGRYPGQGRKGGYLVEQDFIAACDKAGGPGPLISALENHVASDQWQRGKIPGMDKWLKEERWRQKLDPPSAASSDPRLPAWAR